MNDSKPVALTSQEFQRRVTAWTVELGKFAQQQAGIIVRGARGVEWTAR